MRRIILVLVLVVFVLGIASVWAQENTPASSANLVVASPPKVSKVGLTNLLTTESKQIMLPIVVVAFGISALWILYHLSWRNRICTSDTPRYLLLILIVTGALVFISGGFGEKEITSAIGLFGSIAGYLLGKGDSGKGGEDVPKTIES